jgi:hypothetical protein
MLNELSAHVSLFRLLKTETDFSDDVLYDLAGRLLLQIRYLKNEERRSLIKALSTDMPYRE